MGNAVWNEEQSFLGFKTIQVSLKMKQNKIFTLLPEKFSSNFSLINFYVKYWFLKKLKLRGSSLAN